MAKRDLDRIKSNRAPPDWAEPSWLQLGDAGGLTQYGVSLETLGPGGRTSHPHLHDAKHELAYLISGTRTRVEDTGEATLGPGNAAAFPEGKPVGHTLDARSGAPAAYLVVGTRAPYDRVHYTAIDKIEIRQGATKPRIRRHGTPSSDNT